MWTEIVPGLWRAAYQTSMGIESVSYALRLRDGGVAVVSPSPAADDAVFAATEALGPVRALVANNTGHDLGQQPWQARFPDAVTYAPAGVTGAIAKAKPGLRPIQPLAELGALVPDGVRLIDVDGARSGCTVFTVDAGDQRLVFVDEVLSNVPHLHGPAPARLVFWLSGSGPGLVRNKLWWFVFAKDKPAIARAVLAASEGATTLLPAHGDPITGDQVAAARAMLAAMA